MKFPNWRSIVEHYEPTFSVPDIGDFWSLFETGKYTINIARFVNIPPHFHRHSREEFYFLEGSGNLYFSGDVALGADKKLYWDAKTRVRDFVEKGDVAIIPSNVPHSLETKEIYVELINRSPIKIPDGKLDEVPLIITNL